MPFTLRRAVPVDAAALAELAARTFHETFAADNDPDDMAAHAAESYGLEQQGREIADPTIVTILVHVDDDLVAFSQLRRGPAPACVSGETPVEVWRFYIAKEHHGKGIAQALMARVDDDARHMGAKTLWLGVWERNDRAKAFYRKCGFTDVGAHVYMVGTDAQTDRIMVQAAPTQVVVMHDLPFVDEHGLRIDADADAIWSALLTTLRSRLKGAETIARVLGCDPAQGTATFTGLVGDAMPGFRVTESDRGRRMVLHGRHRFAEYALTFIIDGAQLRAQTRAAFPGVLGRLYRAAVISGGGHTVVTRRLLQDVARATR